MSTLIKGKLRVETCITGDASNNSGHGIVVGHYYFPVLPQLQR